MPAINKIKHKIRRKKKREKKEKKIQNLSTSLSSSSISLLLLSSFPFSLESDKDGSAAGSSRGGDEEAAEAKVIRF